MNTLTIEIMVPQPQTFKIPVPFFAKSKDEKEWIGLLNEKTVVDFFKCGDLTMIRNKSADSFYTKEELVKAFTTWEHSNEADFLSHYEALLESISLTPKLVV